MKRNRILFFLALAGLCQLGYSATASNDDKNVMVEGSGDPTETKPIDDEDLIYFDNDFSGNGDTEDGKSEGAIATDNIEGSGDEENRICDNLYCWCTYDDGARVPGTKVYGKERTDCEKFKGMASTAKHPLLRGGAPSATAATDVEIVVTETESNPEPKPEPDVAVHPETEKPETDKPDQAIEYLEDVETTTKLVRVTHKSTTVKPSTMNNKVPGVDRDTPKTSIDKEESVKEEASNTVDNSQYLKAVKEEDLSSVGLYITHPGILAAVIGGGVVGLLCAILLVMFIIYRMRKKDEGSYPLNDSKPLNDYAYSKAPSREFFA